MASFIKYFILKGACVTEAWSLKHHMRLESSIPSQSKMFLVPRSEDTQSLMFLDWESKKIYLRKQSNPSELLPSISLTNVPLNVTSICYFNHILCFLTLEGNIFGFLLKNSSSPLDFGDPLFQKRLIENKYLEEALKMSHLESDEVVGYSIYIIQTTKRVYKLTLSHASLLTSLEDDLADAKSINETDYRKYIDVLCTLFLDGNYKERLKLLLSRFLRDEQYLKFVTMKILINPDGRMEKYSEALVRMARSKPLEFRTQFEFVVKSLLTNLQGGEQFLPFCSLLAILLFVFPTLDQEQPEIHELFFQLSSLESNISSLFEKTIRFSAEQPEPLNSLKIRKCILASFFIGFLYKNKMVSALNEDSGPFGLKEASEAMKKLEGDEEEQGIRMVFMSILGFLKEKSNEETVKSFMEHKKTIKGFKEDIKTILAKFVEEIQKNRCRLVSNYFIHFLAVLLLGVQQYREVSLSLSSFLETYPLYHGGPPEKHSPFTIEVFPENIKVLEEVIFEKKEPKMTS